MRFQLPVALFMAFVSMGATAHSRGLGEESFNLILESVDTATAAELVADRDNVEGLRVELAALRDSGADQTELDAARDVLHSARKSLMADVREIVSNNEVLQEDLRIAAEATRAQRRTERGEQQQARYSELLNVATAAQTTDLEAQSIEIEQLRSELSAAKDAGASREELAILKADIRTANQQQRSLIREIVDANRDALSDVFDHPADGIRDMGNPEREAHRGGHGRRHGGLGG